jgi:hypothetical protein
MAAAAQAPAPGGARGAKDPREIEASVVQKTAAAELARARARAIDSQSRLKALGAALGASVSGGGSVEPT